MSKLLIHGGRRLSGRLTVEGNKNAALPLLAACLLTDETCEIRNVPRIRDVAVMIELLRSLGADVEGQGSSTVRVTCRAVTSSEPDPTLVGRLRGSVLLLGPLVGRRAARASRRPAAIFPRAARSPRTCARCGRWARASSSHRRQRLEAPDGLAGASMYLLEASVTGTETALLAAAQAKGVTEIRTPPASRTSSSCASSCAAMGAGVQGIGTSTMRIEPPGRLHGAAHTLGGDYIEAASWGVVGGRHGRRGGGPRRARDDLEPITAVLRKWAWSWTSRTAALPCGRRS